MDHYLTLVFDWEGTTEGFKALLVSRRETEAMTEFMARLLTDPRRRRDAENQIMNSLCVFEEEVAALDMLFRDPPLIDRWIILLHSVMDFVPRKHPWVKAKIMLWRMERVARETRAMRERLMFAHLRYPEKMALRSRPPTLSSLCFPN
jgi:hypothetical protein